jgi:AcrR family transcriptional regulator
MSRPKRDKGSAEGRHTVPGAPDGSQATVARSRPVLSREVIVEAAIEIVDASGPDALTMRRVAERLGAGTMSLYRHVSGHDELLELVVGAMAADIAVSPLTGEWREDLTAIARDVRSALVRRPHLTVLLTSRSGGGPADLPMLERTLAVLRGAGFSPREAVLANHVLGNFVAGASLWEAVGLAGSTGDERAARRRAAAEMVSQLPPDQFPSLAWVGSEITAASIDERFEFGLVTLLDGLARRLPLAG